MPLVPVRTRWPAVDFGTFPSISSVREEMSRLLDGMLMRPVAPSVALLEATDGSPWIPAVDLSETDTEIAVRVELPGVAIGDVDVSLSGDRLSISGEKKSATESKGNGWLHRESTHGTFNRTLTLPQTVDPAKVQARFDNGVLVVTLVKQPGNEARRIPVTCG